jgi:hypothetical protein
LRTPDDFMEHLAAHKNIDDRLIERARKLTPLEIETSTDPKIVRIRRMVYSVQGEIHRMRGVVRLAPLGRKVLREIGVEVADFFAKRFQGTIIVLGDESRSWVSLCAEGVFLRSRGDGVAGSLEELGRLMDAGAEDDDDVADLWEVYYKSQDQPRKDGKRPFGGRISKRSLKSAGMETEGGRGNAKLGDFI